MLSESHRKSLCIVFEKSRRTVSALQTLQDIPEAIRAYKKVETHIKSLFPELSE